MEKIKLEFSATPSLFPTNGIVVVLTLDEKGKSYKAKWENEIFNSLLGEHKELPPLPKRVLDAFTENAINKILSRLSEEGRIRRITQGLYDVPEYSSLLQEYAVPRPDMVAEALARKFNWTI